MSLVGRDEEKGQVERLLREACGERGGALALRGEPGIGKSVLLDHAVRVARRQGMGVVRGMGVESDAELVYGGLHQLLYPHVDRVETLPAPQAAALRVALGLVEGDEANRFLVSAGTLGLLADLAEEAPLLCVVDDLQWIDQESVAVSPIPGRLRHVRSRREIAGSAFLQEVKRPGDMCASEWGNSSPRGRGAPALPAPAAAPAGRTPRTITQGRHVLRGHRQATRPVCPLGEEGPGLGRAP